MTMQIALRAKDGAIVFASDTKVRTQEEDYSSGQNRIFGMVDHRKIVISENHHIAVALAGLETQENDPTQELAGYLSGQDKITDENFSSLLRAWGDGYFQRRYPGETHAFSLFTLLAVNPHAEYCPFWQLRVRRDSDDLPSETMLVNGNANNSVIFWLEYFQCGKHRYDIATATRIAAFTILMAGEVNPYGVGGLEICVYNGTWKRTPPNQIEDLKTDFKIFDESMHLAVLRCSKT